MIRSTKVEHYPINHTKFKSFGHVISQSIHVFESTQECYCKFRWSSVRFCQVWDVWECYWRGVRYRSRIRRDVVYDWIVWMDWRKLIEYPIFFFRRKIIHKNIPSSIFDEINLQTWQISLHEFFSCWSANRIKKKESKGCILPKEVQISGSFREDGKINSEERERTKRKRFVASSFIE